MKQYSFLSEALDPVTDALVKNRVKNIKKVGTGVLTVGGAGYMIFQSGLNIIFARKITELLRIVRNSELSREECANIVTKVGYTIDKYGTKKVNPATVKFLFSSNIVGPTIQIIKNDDDEQWHIHMIKYLKTMRKVFLAKSVGNAAIGGTALYKFLKRK